MNNEFTLQALITFGKARHDLHNASFLRAGRLKLLLTDHHEFAFERVPVTLATDERPADDSETTRPISPVIQEERTGRRLSSESTSRELVP